MNVHGFLARIAFNSELLEADVRGVGESTQSRNANSGNSSKTGEARNYFSNRRIQRQL